MPYSNLTQRLHQLMQKVGITSFRELSRVSGISERQILRLRRGEIGEMRLHVLLKLSATLVISLSRLVGCFSREEVKMQMPITNPELMQQQMANLQVEYQLLQQQLNQKYKLLQQDFQQSTWQLLESLIVQFPTVVQKVRENSQLPAVKIIPLVKKSLERLLKAWGVEMIANVGAEVPYNPQKHQLMDVNLVPGEIVRVRYTGYRQGNKLLCKAKVGPIVLQGGDLNVNNLS
ncbi:COG0576: Molecular chaperone GrpE (heat shock protein) [Richelia intracellularis HH01]|uniref:COG0576: Molecular chaperone GrpE (Heat shock protein) n=1 Tax=Richelia intracellularis HH01 TaxID=1165094 RepID=M1WZ78_9NOST|nr:nucleotide exchange factor GrpE [Richelia intracellularis]CCH67352.1 COG0576: Molecular chaperone GrpE (heat shock protein) [Richelia intracellularis HH01]